MVSELFNEKCISCFERVRMDEKCLVQYICTELEAEHGKWIELVNGCFHNFSSKCANMLQQHQRQYNTEVAIIQDSFSDLHAKQQTALQVQRRQYRNLLEKISFATTEDQVETFRLETLQHLDRMKQGYQASHNSLLQFLTDQESRLNSMYEKHSDIVCDVLCITKGSTRRETSALDPGVELLNNVDLSIGSNQMESTGHGSGDGSKAAHVDMCQFNNRPPDLLIHGTPYICIRDVISELISVPFTCNEHTTTRVRHEPRYPTCASDPEEWCEDQCAGNVGSCPNINETVWGTLEREERVHCWLTYIAIS